MVASRYGITEASNTIWVYIEFSANKIEMVSLELLARSREIADDQGWQVVGLILGHEIDKVGEDVIAYGADQVRMVDHPLLGQFTIEASTHAALQTILIGKPSILLFGATPNGRDLAGQLAIHLQTGLNADCTNLHIRGDSGVLVSEVSGFGGGVLALIEMVDHRPQMATVRPGVFTPSQADGKRKGEIINLDIKLSNEIIYTKVVEHNVEERNDLTQATNLVVGGRGVNGDFSQVMDLAKLIGGDYGTTRPPVDEGHIERERMIGQTGLTCRPKVAICCGISGAFHFIVGIQEADLVIAINSDPKAEIFDHADYCIVGDVTEILPLLIDELNSQLESKPADNQTAEIVDG